MKTLRQILLLTTSSTFILIAIFAQWLGLDSNPSWGKGRWMVFVLGLFFLAVFADIRFGSSWVESLFQCAAAWFMRTRDKIFDRLHLPAKLRRGIEPATRVRLIHLGGMLASMAVIASYIWFISAGTWKTWPETKYYYDLLADAFTHGQVSLAVDVPPELLALEDPYDSQARQGIDVLWDASLYNGKYYIYWGPAPAVFMAIIKLIAPRPIGDHLIVFAMASGLFLFQALLVSRIWDRFFLELPAWTLLTGIFLAGLGIPFNWMIHRPLVYEASILSAQFFLMGGFYFMYRALESEKISSQWLALTSVFWVGAIASRTIVTFAVIFLVLVVFVRILRQSGIAETSHIYRLILALGLPMMLGAVALGWYNVVRFGSVLDFGLEYQLTEFNNHKYENELFSMLHIPANTYNYLFNPPERTKNNQFPYFKAVPGEDDQVLKTPPPDLYFSERVTGLVYVFPFIVFAFLPVVHATGQNQRESKLLNLIRIASGGTAFISMVFLLLYYYATMRYFADITPTLILLALIGFWSGYQKVKSDGFVKLVYSIVAVLLVSVSIILPNLLALLSSSRIDHFSPEFFSAMKLLFQSLFPG